MQVNSRSRQHLATRLQLHDESAIAMKPNPEDRAMWKPFLITAALAALIGCSRGTEEATPAEPATSSAAAAASDLPTGPAPAPNPEGTPDPAVVERLVEAGIEPDEAKFLALTTYEITQPAPDVAHLVMAYPWGDVYRAGIRARRVDASEVKPFEVLASSIEPGEVSATYRYYVNLAELPPESFATLAAPASQGWHFTDFFMASAHAQRPQQLQPYSGPNAMDASSGWMEIAYTWAVSKLQGDARKAALKRVFGDKVAKGLGAIETAGKLTGISDEARKLLAELDRLRECAENPTNPLTKKQYEQNPAEKQRILDAIAAAKASIQIGGTASISGTTGKAISGAGGAVGKVLGVVLGPLVEKSNADIKQQMKDDVQRIRNMVPSCKASYRIDFATCPGGSRETIRVCDVRKPFTVTACGGMASVAHTPSGERGGTFSFQFRGHGGMATNSGTYTLSGRPDQQLTVTYDNSPVCSTAQGMTQCHQVPSSSATWTKIDDCDE